MLDKIICAGAAVLENKKIKETGWKPIFPLNESLVQPLVLIEAMTYGLPVISFDHGGAKEILQKKMCRFDFKPNIY
ncbi:hypothetical protein EfmJHP36_12330 [Enterococcus faecium]|nr:hypothetical protein EfmJHP36_12330 [Enterococcus faecium]